MRRVLRSTPLPRNKLVLEELEPRIAPTVLTAALAEEQQTQVVSEAGGKAGAVGDLTGPAADPLGVYALGGLAGAFEGSLSAAGLTAPGPGAVILPSIPPDYDWWYGCVPTAAGMLLAWWDQTYDSDIFPGDPNDWVYDVYPSSSPAVFTHANGVAAGWNHAQAHSYQGHVPDSLADFMLTDLDSTYPEDIPHGLEAFVAWDDPRTAANESLLATATLHDSMNGWSYAQYRAEIDAGRPVLLGLTSPSGGHAVLGVGYNNTGGPHIVVLTTWNEGLQEWEWTNEDDSGFLFSVDDGVTFEMVSQPVPELSGYLSIAHTYIGDLVVEVGLGDPADPTWVQTVWNGDGEPEENLVLTNIDLSGALAYLGQDQDWFIEVYDGVAGDSGSLQDFQVWYGGHDGQRWFTADAGGTISDFNYTYAHLTTDVSVLAVTLDPTSDTGVSSSDGITNDTTPLVNVTPASAGTIWVDFNDDGAWDASVVAAAPGTYSVQSPLSLTDGARSIWAMLQESGGGTQYGRLHLTIDTQPPGAPTAAPDLDAASDTGPSQVDNITADTTPTLLVSGFGSAYQLLRASVRVSGEWETASTFTELLPVAEGVHSYAVRAVDAAGNASAGSPALQVTVDTTPPVILATLPADGSFVHNVVTQASATFSERVNDSLLAANVLLEGSGGDGHFGDGNEYVVPLTLQYEAGNNSATFQLASPLPTDLYRLHVNPGLQDMAGNPLDGDHDGFGGDAYLGEFRVEASYTWQQGAAMVTVYDLSGTVDFRPEDVQVHFGRGDAVSSIRLRGSHSLEGVGIVIHGATSVGKITDSRKGPIGDLAFVASDSPLAGLSVKGPLAGYNLNGLSLGGLDFEPDIDGDGDTSDLTAVYVAGGLKAAKLNGSVVGDVTILGSVGNLQTMGPLAGDLWVNGSVKNLRIGGDLGYVGGRAEISGDVGKLSLASRTDQADLLSDLEIGGNMRGLSVGTRTLGGDVWGDVTVWGDSSKLTVAGSLNGEVRLEGDLGTGRISGDVWGPVDVQGSVSKLTTGLIYGPMYVAGNLGSLTTASEVTPGVDPLDFLLVNPTPEPNGSLMVGGTVGRVRQA